MPEPCDHKFVYLESKKIRGRPPSFGWYAAANWERTDIYFCEKCLEKKITKQEGFWMDYLYKVPDWW